MSCFRFFCFEFRSALFPLPMISPLPLVIHFYIPGRFGTTPLFLLDDLTKEGSFSPFVFFPPFPPARPPIRFCRTPPTTKPAIDPFSVSFCSCLLSSPPFLFCRHSLLHRFVLMSELHATPGRFAPFSGFSHQINAIAKGVHPPIPIIPPHPPSVLFSPG